MDRPFVPGEWASRAHLPHCDIANVFQVVTFRLHDSLPVSVRSHLQPRQPVGNKTASVRIAETNARRRAVEDPLDGGYGSCLLRDPRDARLLTQVPAAFHQDRYLLAE